MKQKKKSLESFAQEVTNSLMFIMRGAFQRQTDLAGLGKLTFLQGIILQLLKQSGAMKMKEIARILHISLPAATNVINRLHDQKMVKRAGDPADRRIVYIKLTPKGTRNADKVRLQKKKIIANLFSRLTERERMQYLRIIRKLKKVIDEETSAK